jgi:diadenosine tetraphosphate (Ap4A) HIT family hydrolase
MVCSAGAPLDVIAETNSIWVTAQQDAPLPGYVCVVSKQHVCEPFELSQDAQAAFWVEATKVAAAIANVDDPVKMNYEVHGNTIPHLHLHLFPRHRDDPYVGGPIDPRIATFRRSKEQIAAIQEAVRGGLETGGS